MAARHNRLSRKIAFILGIVFAFAAGTPAMLSAQAPAPAVATVPPKLGTVKTISGTSVTLATDAGATVTITVPDGTKVQQLAVGSTDLKTAKPGQFSDIAVGDRVLAAVKSGDTPDSFVAKQVVVMKSADIAQMQAAQQADWKARGVGGIVSTVDAATGTITITSGAKKVVINTSSKTEFKRFASDSVKYQDAKAGTLAQVQAKDQLEARGTKSADGTSIQADEVVSGSFEDVSGQIITADAGKITLKDLATKKLITVNLTPNSDLRQMPLQLATRFAAQTNGGGGGQGGGRGGGGGAAAGGSGYGGGAGGQGAGGGMRSAGADLSQMITRFPVITLADLHKGDAVMIVASASTPGASTVTAITVLTGVDPILTANPNGGMNLSSWSIGGGGGDQ